MNQRKPTIGTKTRYWPRHEQEKQEKYVEIFVRSLLEMIRQQPGIRQADLRSMYTRREQVFVDEALKQLKSDYRVMWKEDGNSPRLFIGKPGAVLREERNWREAP